MLKRIIDFFNKQSVLSLLNLSILLFFLAPREVSTYVCLGTELCDFSKASSFVSRVYKDSISTIRSSAEGVAIPMDDAYFTGDTVCNITGAQEFGVCQSRSALGMYGVGFVTPTPTISGILSLTYYAKLMVAPLRTKIIGEITVNSGESSVTSNIIFFERIEPSDYLLEMSIAIACNDTEINTSIQLSATGKILEIWTFGPNGTFDGKVSESLRCDNWNFINIALPTSLGEMLNFQLRPSNINEVQINDWSLSLIPIRTLIRFEDEIATGEPNILIRHVKLSVYFIDSGDNIAIYRRKQGIISPYNVPEIPTDWFQFGIVYNDVHETLDVYLNNILTFNTLMVLSLLNLRCTIGSIDGIFDNLFLFDGLVHPEYWSDIITYQQEVVLTNGTISPFFCRDEPYFQLSFEQNSSISMKKNVPSLTAGYFCNDNCTVLTYTDYIKNITYAQSFIDQNETSLGVQIMNFPYQNLLSLNSFVYYYSQSFETPSHPPTPIVLLFANSTNASADLEFPPSSVLVEFFISDISSQGMGNYTSDLAITINGNPPLNVPLCLWRYTSAIDRFELLNPNTTSISCTNFEIVPEEQRSYYNYRSFFLIPNDPTFQSGYTITVTTDLLFAEQLKAGLLIHHVTNFLTFGTKVVESDVIRPYFAVISNTRAIFQSNQFNSLVACAPRVDNFNTEDEIEIDVIQIRNLVELKMNCYDGFDYAEEYDFQMDRPIVPHSITIGPVDGLILNITYANISVDDFSVNTLNTKYIPPCIPITPRPTGVPTSQTGSTSLTPDPPMPSKPEVPTLVFNSKSPTTSISKSISQSMVNGFFPSISPPPTLPSAAASPVLSRSVSASRSPQIAIPPISDITSSPIISSNNSSLPSAPPFVASPIVIPSITGASPISNDVIIQPIPIDEVNNNVDEENTQQWNDVVYITYSADDFVATSENSSFVYLVIAPTPPRITADTQNYLSETDTELSSEVIDVSLIGGEVDGKVEICLKNKKAGDSKKDDSCLGYIDESTNKWKCEDRCLKNEKNDYLCGNTNHFTSFAILFNGIAKGGKCGSHDDYILNSTNEDVILSFSVLAFVCLIGLIFAIIMTMTPLKRYLYGKEGYRVHNLRKKQFAVEEELVSTTSASVTGETIN